MFGMSKTEIKSLRLAAGVKSNLYTGGFFCGPDLLLSCYRNIPDYLLK